MLATYLQAAHRLLDANGAAYDYQILMETQFFAGDLDGARDTAQRIADPEDRMYAWTNIFGSCLENDDDATIWALLEGETLLNGHLDFLSYLLEDDKLKATDLHALRARTDPQAIETLAAIWGALARLGEAHDALAFFAAQTLPAYMQDNWRADVAIGFALQGNLAAASKHLGLAKTDAHGRALIALGAHGVDQAFLDQEVDRLLDRASADDRPNVGPNALRQAMHVPGQWPRLSSRLDKLESADRQIAMFQAIWHSEGKAAAWAVLKDVAPWDATNAVVAALHDHTDYFAHRAIAEWDDAGAVNNLRGALLLRAIKTGDLDAALDLGLNITPVADPPESMQPYYRDTNREHVSEALLKAGRIRDLKQVHKLFEQPERQLRWACKIALALISLDQMTEAQAFADTFHSGFDELSPEDTNRGDLLGAKAALFMGFGQFDAALALADTAEDWSRDRFPADAVSIAASCGRYHAKMAEVVDAAWTDSTQDDMDLLNATISASYALEASKAQT